jgi:SAM-dependent methyltransferase
MKQIKNCDLCGSDNFHTLYIKSIKNSLPWSNFINQEEFPIIVSGTICKNCGWIFQNPSYTDIELDLLYNYSDSNTLSQEAKELADLNAKKRGKILYDIVIKHFTAQTKKILDVGGRNGELMQVFDTNKYNISVLDMDAGEPINKEYEKIRIPFLKFETKIKFDLITMLHVLEHTDSPSNFLKKANKLLNDNGLIYIEVPSELITHLIIRHVGDHRHLGYFSSNVLAKFLESNGFECIYCKVVEGLVGGRVAVIRAIGRKSNSLNNNTFKNKNLLFFKSVMEVFSPIPMIVRLKNYLRI